MCFRIIISITYYQLTSLEERGEREREKKKRCINTVTHTCVHVRSYTLLSTVCTCTHLYWFRASNSTPIRGKEWKIKWFRDTVCTRLYSINVPEIKEENHLSTPPLPPTLPPFSLCSSFLTYSTLPLPPSLPPPPSPLPVQ